MVKPLPRKWLIHEIEYVPLIGKDENYDEPLYGSPTIVKNVRVDIDVSVLIGGQDHNQTDSLLVFVDYKNSSPIVEFIEESKVIFKGKEYRLQKVVPCYQVDKDEIHHYELELV